MNAREPKLKTGTYAKTRTRSKLSNRREQLKLTRFFTSKSVENEFQDEGSTEHLTNGFHCECKDSVTSEFSNIDLHCIHTEKDAKCIHTKQDMKVQNGILPVERPLSSICTRSQSQKLLADLAIESPKKIAKGQMQPHPEGGSAEPVTSTNGERKDCVLDLSKEVVMNGSPQISPTGGPTTPHKIQALNEAKLRLDSPLSPSSVPKFKIISPKKLKFSKQFSTSKTKLPKENNTDANTNSTTSINASAREKPKPTNGTWKTGSASPSLKTTKMTQFFPIRRSHRKPKAALLQEQQKEIEERILSEKEEGLQVCCFQSKGRGVKTTRLFKKGEMVVEYVGNLIDMKEAKEREEHYALDATKGCYMYYFTFQNTQYCIDATEESGYLGRLVNHSRNGNLATKAVEVNGKPHLILMAKKDLEPGTEILYDYGDRSKQSLEHHPWLAL